MKTAEEILLKVTEFHTGTGYTAPCIIEAMQEYAKQFIDKCAEDFIYEPCRDDSYNIYDWEVNPDSISAIKKLL